MKNILCIDPSWFTSYLARRAELRDKIGSIDAAAFSASKANKRDILSVSGDTATITISGMLSDIGPSIMDWLMGNDVVEYGAIIDAARTINGSPEVSKVILSMSTPGGTVNMLDSTYEALLSLSESKEVTAVINGTVASAGVWLASAANKIVASGESSRYGSIGVAYDYYDFSGVDGYPKWVGITNHESPDKRPDLSTDDGRDVIVDELDDIYKVFTDRVISGRERAGVPFSKDAIDALKGRMMIAQTAVDNGFIDEIANKRLKKAPQKQETKTMKIETTASAAGEITAAGQGVDPVVAVTSPDASDETKKRFAAARPYLANNAYPEALQKLALSVMDGEASIDALIGAVAVLDALKESEESKVATQKTIETPPTVGDVPEISTDGVIRNDADLQAAIEKARAHAGR